MTKRDRVDPVNAALFKVVVEVGFMAIVSLILFVVAYSLMESI